MHPADSALGAVFRSSHDRLAIPIRLKDLLRTQGNADVACLAPTEIDIQGRRSLGIVILAFAGRFGL